MRRMQVCACAHACVRAACAVCAGSAWCRAAPGSMHELRTADRRAAAAAGGRAGLAMSLGDPAPIALCLSSPVVQHANSGSPASSKSLAPDSQQQMAAVPPMGMFAGPSSMNMQSGITPGPHSHVTCGGCSTLLMYPQQGASQVRCSRCGHITQAPPSPDNPEQQSQIVCNGCRVLLSYPRGAQSVQCSLCHTVTQVPVYGHVQCGGCSIMLLYPLGAQSVKCSVCHFVTNVCQHAAWPPPQAPQAPQARPGGGPPKQTVVVENPPTLDEQGNEVANIAVAVKDSRQP